MTTTPPPPEPGDQRWPVPPPPPSAYQPPPPASQQPRPKAVEVSFWLWITYLVLSAIGSLVELTQIDRIKAEAISGVLAQDPTLDRAMVERLATGALVAGLVIALVLVVVEFVCAYFMRQGRNWARIVLTVLGGIGVLFALISLMRGAGLGSSIIQLALLSAAIATMYVPTANPWFQLRRPAR